MKDELIRKKYLNKSISKYDKGQITTVLQECKTRKDKLEDRYYLAQKLFVATISGDKTARIYFNDFKKQIGMLDGIYAESYDYDLKEKLKEWDTE